MDEKTYNEIEQKVVLIVQELNKYSDFSIENESIEDILKKLFSLIGPCNPGVFDMMYSIILERFFDKEYRIYYDFNTRTVEMISVDGLEQSISILMDPTIRSVSIFSSDEYIVDNCLSGIEENEYLKDLLINKCCNCYHYYYDVPNEFECDKYFGEWSFYTFDDKGTLLKKESEELASNIFDKKILEYKIITDYVIKKSQMLIDLIEGNEPDSLTEYHLLYDEYRYDRLREELAICKKEIEVCESFISLVIKGRIQYEDMRHYQATCFGDNKTVYDFYTKTGFLRNIKDS